MTNTHSEQHKFNCFVNYCRDKLKPLPKHMRESAFNSLTAKRGDKAEVKRAIFKVWDK